MAFVKTNLSLVSYSGNGFHIWHYTTTDAKATIDSANYFNDASSEMNVGDIIFANTSTGGTPEYGMFCVNANSGGAVDTADLVSLSGTDTD
ncbi:hypothetical protein [uncultured Mediterranean phage uvMED]|nr:hypothetical protein [uncultured Mediterranean phage uvMED]BAQ87220.1 hypothetical protein [uncultured Mediterranean phage uvMED]BAQ87235.1 hypothetical protein [uncultured Mediterranean phage uvMED]BAQ87306.1 hypothetical protein [uncultured Mediterranean phage uvMED]BAQ87364.1 hypothetical protein [uncultured Mediterranean phage uvMED]|tara:strand:- start:6523 stop:6795 length:273 start_codon:yes stop_codon:yes gene_type:complete